ncbi:2',3'-cyclic-nucleotide 2'-phosphodiesterase/3'-nucleotidase [Hypnocyclicus thermotrophus]|uniref:2',3'-cyclic-nucleotide 2'-phosphodiesterase/3'-nucleotidase n=1 Tax=Hypnocyclicus thermotrophus TaxID=1627895 RepID=A0AA46E095_9FUSO|nr:5'-nucleotidase C-terminal domain-containing protein [Hypnocyclicus thermotrophus]TDT72469.1 2',3'-cyclic-nucleotide 2'-phosphodiesterase/3'-nucleotidase [Hypnocyclicus thermotrophus]
MRKEKIFLKARASLVFMFLLSVMIFGADKKITIMETSDIHGRIYAYDYAIDAPDKDAGLAKIMTIIKEEKAKDPDTILIDNGDTVQDNSAELFNDLPTHPMIQSLNLMKYDVWVLGNHEFNFDLNFLKRNIKGFNGTVLAGNIYNTDNEERFVKAYKIFNIKGVRVAIVGMITPNVTRWEASSPEHFEGLRFTKLIDETEKVLNELNGKYDVLIGSYHLGRKGEYGGAGLYDIADKFPQFDVLFGGHEHAKYIENRNGVQLIEPGKYGAAVAKAVITVSENKDKYKVASIKLENIDTIKVKEDKEILDKFEFVDKKSKEDANKVVGKITDDFIKGVDYITKADKVTTMPTAQVEDTAIIDLINDVQMFYSKADVSSAALFNFGSNLKKGEFKKKDVAYIYKYPNTLIGVKITGKNLKKYMEWSASYYNIYQYGDLTVSFNPNVRGYNYDMFSGVTYDINLSKEAGNRIENLKFKGKPIDENKIYKLAVNNYRFGTLLGLKLVTPADKYYDSYATMQDSGRIRALIIKYVQEEKNGVISPKVDNNWKITGVILEHPLKNKVFDMVKKGEIKIPTSSDGRTKNIKSLNIRDLENKGIIKLSDIKGIIRYKVKPGDTLSKIVKDKNIEWKDIAQLNGLKNPNRLKVGQIIYLY